jgi:hypothetical protein
MPAGGYATRFQLAGSLYKSGMELKQRVAALVDAHAGLDVQGFVEHVQAALLEKSNFKLLQDLAGTALQEVGPTLAAEAAPPWPDQSRFGQA